MLARQGLVASLIFFKPVDTQQKTNRRKTLSLGARIKCQPQEVIEECLCNPDPFCRTSSFQQPHNLDC